MSDQPESPADTEQPPGDETDHALTPSVESSDPTSKIAEDFAAIKEQWQSEVDSLKAKLGLTRPVPNPVMPDGQPLSEDALTQSNQIHALAAQEINRLRQLDQPGKHLTLADLLDGPLHP